MRIGENDLGSVIDCDGCPPAVEYDIESVHIHPDYVNYRNDIALIRLQKAVPDSKFSRTVCLPLDEENFLDTTIKTKLQIMGFGRTEKNTTTNVMLKALVPLVPANECASSYANTSVGEVHEKYFCAGGNMIDTCRGKYYYLSRSLLIKNVPIRYRFVWL